MVNAELLAKQVDRFKLTQHNATVFHKNLFALHPETTNYFDADEFNPDHLHRSRKFQMIGMGIVRRILALPEDYTSQEYWAETVKSLVLRHKEYDVPMEEFKKCTPAIVKMLEESEAGCSAEEKKAWEELMEELFKAMEAGGYE